MRCFLWLGILMAPLLASCSHPEVIVADYKLIDGSGSNQWIHGAGGKIGVAHVSAYDLLEDRIYFETTPPPRISKERPYGCVYGYIDTERDIVLYADKESILQSRIKAHLLDYGKSKIALSCLESDQSR